MTKRYRLTLLVVDYSPSYFSSHFIKVRAHLDTSCDQPAEANRRSSLFNIEKIII
jgi:hypothetical protein